MLVRRSALVAGLALSLAACSGGGGGSGSSSGGSVPGGGGGSAPQSNYVTPKFSFVLPARSNSSSVARSTALSGTRSPNYISPAANGVTITLIVEGQPNVSVTTDLATPGVCTGTPTTCTVSGPAIPAGTDQLQITLYDAEPMGSPLAEPATANVLAQSSSSASPVTPNPTYTIAPGVGQQLTVTLFGVPRILSIDGARRPTARGNDPKPQIAPSGTPTSPPSVVDVPQGGTFVAGTQNQQGPVDVTVEDAKNNPISGQYSEPVTLTDNDKFVGTVAGTYATGIACCGSTTGAGSVVLNSSSDLSSLIMTYGGLAEDAPTVTISAAGATSDTEMPFYVANFAISVNPEVDLYAESGPGSSGTFDVQERGWSDPPYSQDFSYTENGCTSGVASTTYSLGPFGAPQPNGVVAVVDTAPAGATAGICSILIGSFDPASVSKSETLTYTSGSFGINARNRTR